MAATACSMRPNHLTTRPLPIRHPTHVNPTKLEPWGGVGSVALIQRRALPGPLRAGSRADDSLPFEMSMEYAVKLLGVSEEASFDDILRAKNSIIASCKDDREAVAQVEAAYDMLLMRSLTQRRKGKVVDKSIRYADVKPMRMPQWVQTMLRKQPVAIESPSLQNLGIQGGVYGALMLLTYVNGITTPYGMPSAGADAMGLVVATSFGASLYLMSRKNVKLGKSVLITAGGLVAGAVVGSAVESWLQVEIVPFLGLHSPAALITEFILFTQFLVTLYLI